jgi:hypothetical protein
MIKMPRGFVPITASYTVGGPDGVVETQVAGGAARYAMEYDRGVQPFGCVLILNPTQFQVWQLWYLHIAKKGSVTFEMPLDSGFGVSPHACNIVPGSYSTARVGDINTSVSFVVKAESQAYQYSAADAAAIIELHNGIEGDDLSALLARLAQFALYDTNVLRF